jgi:hypothetical protein
MAIANPSTVPCTVFMLISSRFSFAAGKVIGGTQCEVQGLLQARHGSFLIVQSIPRSLNWHEANIARDAG